MYSIHITPRCRRPARGQVFLKTLRVDGDSFSFTLPSACFTLRPSPNPRVIFASDRRADGEMSGIRRPARRDRHADYNGHGRLTCRSDRL
ncbi:hypothetical protein ECZU34_62860 [Escherichia coli]|nr:hypothetical protein ECZU34_62860 [Escherichia coli]